MDIVALPFPGVLSTYSSWALGLRGSSEERGDPVNVSQGLMLAAYASCSVMRTASYSAYQVAGRGMVAEDIVGHLTGAAEKCLRKPY
jgi:hypothetical protein